jgi:hypothetical protein
MICCVDGLAGFPDAIEASTRRHGYRPASSTRSERRCATSPYKDRKAIARDLKPVYRAVNPDAAREAIEAFDEQWGERYPMMTESWLARWEHIHAVPGRTPSRDGPACRLSGHSSWPVPYSVAAVREPPSTDSPAITTTIATPPPPTAIRQVELPLKPPQTPTNHPSPARLRTLPSRTPRPRRNDRTRLGFHPLTALAPGTDSRFCRCPAKGPCYAPAWADPTGLPVGSRKGGPVQRGGPPFLESPGGKLRKHPGAGRRPVALMAETHRAKRMEGNGWRETTDETAHGRCRRRPRGNDGGCQL